MADLAGSLVDGITGLISNLMGSQTTTNSSGNSNSTTNATSNSNSTTSTLDPATISFLQNLVTGGTFSKSSAITDSQNAVMGAMQSVMQNYMPTIAASSKGSGMMNDSMSQILSTQLATQAAVQGGQVQMNAISSYGGLLNNLLQTLTQGSPQVTTAGTSSNQAQNQTATSTQKATTSTGCFITSAMCEQLGYEDDCSILTRLREFRDTYMQGSEELKEKIALYYKIAPKIVEEINKLPKPEKDSIYTYLRATYIFPASNLLENEKEAAHNTVAILYEAMVMFLVKKFGVDPNG